MNQFSSLGRIKELIFLFLPILIMTFSSSLFLIVEKLLLGRFSVLAMEAAVSSAYASQVFQAPCVALAMMAQVFVGRWFGARQLEEIGAGLWQFIWFSLLSTIFVIPLGILYGKYYFSGTNIESIAMPYYYFLICMSFLFPLGVTLSSFYLGQGKTRLILFANIGFQSIKLLLGYLLIFGWSPWIPSLGLMGGILSTFISQLGFCILLLAIFLNKKHRMVYGSSTWYFNPKLFLTCIHPGVLRALNRILNFTSWAAIAHLMTTRGADYTLALSIGGTLFLFLPFLSEAICQAQTTIVSQILGIQNLSLLKRAFHSAVFLVLIVIAFVALPLVIFPDQTFHFLFPAISLDPNSIHKILLGVWISFVFYTFLFIPISSILAFKDTKFSFFMGLVSWVNGYAWMFFAIKIIEISPDQFWLALSVMHASNALFYYLRMRWLHTQGLEAVKTPA